MTISWARACVLAEMVGITAAATAARAATWLTDAHDASALVALGVVVAGGLVEGTALGVLQASALRPRIGKRAGRRWAMATVLVAGLAWAAGSAPSALAPAADDRAPALALVLTGAAGLGALTGTLLGVAQAAAVRRSVGSSWRWAATSALGWTAAMPVIFLGATLPSTDWPTSLVVLLGAVTGAAAGTVLGVLTRGGAERLGLRTSSQRSKVPSLGAIRP